MIATVVVGRDQTFLSQPCVAARTIQAATGGTGVIDFDLPDAPKGKLRDDGWSAADRFPDTWDWDHDCERCRGASAT